MHPINVFLYLLGIFLNTYECTKYPLIAGGTKAKPDQFPFFAQLEIIPRKSSKGKLKHCGGTLIHPRWILTAGHCFTVNIKSLLKNGTVYVYMGGNSAFDPSRAKITTVKSIKRHPNYTAATRDTYIYDVALCRLEDPYNIQVVKLPGDAERCSLGTLVGIGNTDFVKNKTSSFVRYAFVKSQNEPAFPTHSWTSTRFYSVSGLNQGHASSGDSGGPYLCYPDKKNKNLAVQYGIVSSGGAQTSQKVQTAFENVKKYIIFITKFVDEVETYERDTGWELYPSDRIHRLRTFRNNTPSGFSVNKINFATTIYSLIVVLIVMY